MISRFYCKIYLKTIETLFFAAGTKPAEVVYTICQKHLSFPLIGKPDIGMQGIAVKKLDNKAELIEYIFTTKVDFLVVYFWTCSDKRRTSKTINNH